MPDRMNWSNRRTETRLETDDVIRWKHPGKAEDNKAWIIDRSPSGLGFLTRSDNAPQSGDLLHIRRLDGDQWATIERTIRVARTSHNSSDDLAVVGCTLEPPVSTLDVEPSTGSA